LILRAQIDRPYDEGSLRRGLEAQGYHSDVIRFLDNPANLVRLLRALRVMNDVSR
jgi:hypothetical protein